jgi:hypothetical protein
VSRHDRTLVRIPGSGGAGQDDPLHPMAHARRWPTVFPPELAPAEPGGFFARPSWWLKCAGVIALLYAAYLIGWSSAEPAQSTASSPPHREIAAPATTAMALPSERPVTIAPTPAATTSRRLSDEEFREIQFKLDALGHDPGPLDGLFGPQTVAAVRRYEIARGLEPTGHIDMALLERLRHEP